MNNPGLLSEFDPREWHPHSVTAKIYEDSVLREFGPRIGQTSFRTADKKQTRLDAKLLQVAVHPDAVRQMLRQYISLGFATAIKRYYEPGTRIPNEKSARASFDRYAGRHVGSDGRVRDLDDLVNSRQSYEEMLAIPRGEGFYRVTEEPTAVGPRWFIWPLPPGERLPFPATSSQELAMSMAAELNRTKNPLVTNKWHVPNCSYTKRELEHWLPPSGAFFKQTEARPPVVEHREDDLMILVSIVGGAMSFYVYEKPNRKKKLSPDFSSLAEAQAFRDDLRRRRV